jgi:hypothetical protein
MKRIFFFIVIFSLVTSFCLSQIPSRNWLVLSNLGASFPNHNSVSNGINPNDFFGAEINYRLIEPGQNFLSNKYQYEWGSRINFLSTSFNFHSDKISPLNKNPNKISSDIIKLQFSNYQGSGYLQKDFKFYPFYNTTLGYNYLLFNPNKETFDADELIIPASYMLFAPNNIVFAKSNFYTPETNINSLKAYNNKIKIGSSRETGFMFQFHNKLCLRFGYECTIIYPQYVWLQSQTSDLIESSIQNLLGFILLIIDYIAANEISSFGDYIVNSIITMGFQNFRKAKMNWPLNSDRPLYLDSFKFGIGLQL